MTRICNLRGQSSSPNVPIAHGDDQVTLWKPNGTYFPDIRRRRGGEKNRSVKSLGAMKKLLSIFMGFLGKSHSIWKWFSSNSDVPRVSLIVDLIYRLGGAQTREVLAGRFGISQPIIVFWWSPKSPSGVSLLLSDDCRALRRKLFWFQKCKMSVRELYELDAVCGLVPTENPALGKSLITQSNPIECTRPSYVYKITYVLIFQRIRAKDLDHACWTSN